MSEYLTTVKRFFGTQFHWAALVCAAATWFFSFSAFGLESPKGADVFRTVPMIRPAAMPLAIVLPPATNTVNETVYVTWNYTMGATYTLRIGTNSGRYAWTNTLTVNSYSNTFRVPEETKFYAAVDVATTSGVEHSEEARAPDWESNGIEVSSVPLVSSIPLERTTNFKTWAPIGTVNLPYTTSTDGASEWFRARARVTLTARKLWLWNATANHFGR